MTPKSMNTPHASVSAPLQELLSSPGLTVLFKANKNQVKKKINKMPQKAGHKEPPGSLVQSLAQHRNAVCYDTDTAPASASMLHGRGAHHLPVASITGQL